MSRILWSKALLPPKGQPIEDYDATAFYGARARVPNTLRIPTLTEDFKLPDPRAVRSMSRAAVMMANVCMSAQEALAPFLAKSPFSVGVYCAVENGPIDYPSTQQMLELSQAVFAERYKKLRNPKMYLKQLPNLAAAQMGIFLNLQGAMNVYNHSIAGGIQALDQAESDLERGSVEAALVCSSFSFEEPLLTMRAHRFGAKGRVLSEGAAGILLVKDAKKTVWSQETDSDPAHYYGIGQEIITVAARREAAHSTKPS